MNFIFKLHKNHQTMNKQDDNLYIQLEEEPEVNYLTHIYNNIAYVMGCFISCACIPFICCGPIMVIEQGYVGVLTRYGIYKKILNPGRYSYNVFVDNIIIVSLKTQNLNISTQKVMTSDNLSVVIDAVCFFNITDAKKSLFNVDNYKDSLDNLSKTTLRTVIGENDLNSLFSNRSLINKRVSELIKNYSSEWGIGNISIEIKDVSLPDELKRSMAQISEAKMQAQAKLISANADSQSIQILKTASLELSQSPEALKLIWFNTLKDIAKEKSNTIVVSENILTKIFQ